MILFKSLFVYASQFKLNLDIHFGFVRLQQRAHLFRKEPGHLETMTTVCISNILSFFSVELISPAVLVLYLLGSAANEGLGVH